MKRKSDPVKVVLEEGKIRCTTNNLFPRIMPEKCKVVIQRKGGEVHIIAFFGKIQCGSDAKIIKTAEEIVIQLPPNLQLPPETRTGQIHQVVNIEGAVTFTFPPSKTKK
jgi:hypothetical protein